MYIIQFAEGGSCGFWRTAQEAESYRHKHLQERVANVVYVTAVFLP